MVLDASSVTQEGERVIRQKTYSALPANPTLWGLVLRAPTCRGGACPALGLAHATRAPADRAEGGSGDDLERPGPGEGSGAVVCIELAIDMLKVLLDRARRNHQAGGNLAVRISLGHKLEYFAFALA